MRSSLHEKAGLVSRKVTTVTKSVDQPRMGPFRHWLALGHVEGGADRIVRVVGLFGRSIRMEETDLTVKRQPQRSHTSAVPCRVGAISDKPPLQAARERDRHV